MTPFPELREVVTSEFGSPDWLAAARLREDVLRKPLGMVATPEDRAAERGMTLVALFEPDGPVAALMIQDHGERGTQIRQVAVRADRQGQGIGKRLMALAMPHLTRCPYWLNARGHVIPFYESLGWVAEGPEFEQVGLPHRRMVYSPER